MRKTLAMMVPVMCLVFGGVAQAGVVIDNFNTGGVPQTVSPMSVNETGLGGTVSTDRTTSLTGTGQSTVTINTVADASVGVCQFSNNTGAAETLTLEYDIITGTGGTADLTNGGVDDRVRFTFFNADQPYSLTLQVQDGTNTGSVTKPGTAVPSAVSHLDVLFSELVGGADVTSATYVEIQLTPTVTAGGDYEFDLIETEHENGNGNIPEPGALVLVAGGLVGLLRRKRD
jgi:hypothetical protein